MPREKYICNLCNKELEVKTYFLDDENGPYFLNKVEHCNHMDCDMYGIMTKRPILKKKLTKS